MFAAPAAYMNAELFGHGREDAPPRHRNRCGLKSGKLAYGRARTVRHDGGGVPQSALADIYPACQNDECAWRDFARRDDAIARRIGFELTEPPQPTNLRRLQDREH